MCIALRKKAKTDNIKANKLFKKDRSYGLKAHHRTRNTFTNTSCSDAQVISEVSLSTCFKVTFTRLVVTDTTMYATTQTQIPTSGTMKTLLVDNTFRDSSISNGNTEGDTESRSRNYTFQSRNKSYYLSLKTFHAIYHSILADRKPAIAYCIKKKLL